MHICTSCKEIDRIIIHHYKHDSWLNKLKKGVKSLNNLAYIYIIMYLHIMNPHKKKITLITMEIDNPLTIKLELDTSWFINKRSVQKKVTFVFLQIQVLHRFYFLALTSYFFVSFIECSMCVV